MSVVTREKGTRAYFPVRAPRVHSLFPSCFSSIFVRRGSARKDVASRIAKEKKRSGNKRSCTPSYTTWLCAGYVMAAREYTNSSFEFREYRQDGSCIFQQQQQLADRNFSRCSTRTSSSYSFFFFFSYAKHIPFVKRTRFSRFAVFLSHSGFSLFRQLIRACLLDSTVFTCVSRHVSSSFFPQVEARVRETGYREDRDSATLRDGEYDHCYVVKLVVSVRCRNVFLDCLCVFFLSLSLFLSVSLPVFHIQNNHARSTAKPPRLLSINCILQSRAGTELYISSLRCA